MPVKYACRHAYDDLLDRGIEIYEYQPTMMHTKSLVVDGVWSMFGSANFDNRSLELNDELNLAVAIRDLAARLPEDLRAGLAARQGSRARASGGAGRSSKRRASTSGATSGRSSRGRGDPGPGSGFGYRNQSQRWALAQPRPWQEPVPSFWTSSRTACRRRQCHSPVAISSAGPGSENRVPVDTPWSASASLPRPPATCTSAARARRCSTGCSRGGTAARSCCASRTPTPSARRGTWSTGILDGLRWLGLDWDEGPDVGGPHAPVLPVAAARGLSRRRRAAGRGRARLLLLLLARGAAGEARRRRRRRAAVDLRPHLLRADRGRDRASARRPARRARSASRCRRGRRRSTIWCTAPIDVRQRAHRRLRHPPLRRPADVSPLGRRATTSTWRSRTSSAATITSRTRRSRCCCIEAFGRRRSRRSRTCR